MAAKKKAAKKKAAKKKKSYLGQGVGQGLRTLAPLPKTPFGFRSGALMGPHRKPPSTIMH
jgi:hypothetical protein